MSRPRYMLVDWARIPIIGRDRSSIRSDSFAEAQAMAAVRRGAYVLDTEDGHIVRDGLPGLVKCEARKPKWGAA